mgnify:CR=1 FL=1
MELLKCKYCGKECKNKLSLSTHQTLCKFNPNRRDLSGKNNPHYGKEPPNKISEHASFKCRNGDLIDKSRKEIKEYKETHFVCEICGKTENLCVDHDHKTKKFRGLLCQACNRALGWFENNKENIEKYLARGNA